MFRRAASLTRRRIPTASLFTDRRPADLKSAANVAIGQSICGGCAAMHGAEIVVEQLDVSPGHLDRSWAVAEDALKAEDVAAVRQEGARERMAQHVGRATGLDASSSRQPTDELMDASCG